jgi:nucleotide-binding universal stress UspA family protein
MRPAAHVLPQHPHHADDRPVLLAHDGSAASHAAARWAAATAVGTGRVLRVATIRRWPVPELGGLGLPSHALDVEHAERTAAGALDSALRLCRGIAPEAELHGEVLAGDPVELLAELADAAALLVLGAAGQTAHPLVLLGSTAAELARRVATPLAVIRREPAGPPAAPVVVGVDGSPASAAATWAAFAAAARDGRPVEAVHAWSDLPVAALGADVPVDPERARADAAGLLDEQLAEARRQYPDVAVRTVVAVERPTSILLDRARGAALLVVGRRGRAHATGTPLGSVSHAVLHYAPCPVLLTG